MTARPHATNSPYEQKGPSNKTLQLAANIFLISYTLDFSA